MPRQRHLLNLNTQACPDQLRALVVNLAWSNLTQPLQYMVRMLTQFATNAVKQLVPIAQEWRRHHSCIVQVVVETFAERAVPRMLDKCRLKDVQVDLTIALFDLIAT